MALRPSFGIFAAWAARPWQVAVMPPVPLREWMMSPLGRAGSKTKPKWCRGAASSNIARVPCEPVSSSGVSSTSQPRLAAWGVCSKASSAASITMRPPFMSVTPGPLRVPSASQRQDWKASSAA